MKKILIIFILTTLSSSVCFSQWLWSKQIGSNSNNFPYDILSGLINDGTNHYLIGAYGGNLFLPSDTLNCNGITDIFISKFNDSGNMMWSSTIGGNVNQISSSEIGFITFSNQCNCIYMAGSFNGYVSFGGSISLTGDVSYRDIFVARMNLDGIFSWAVKMGSNNLDFVQPFIQPDGSILLAGEFLGIGTIGTTTLNPGGFLAKFDSTGTFIWAANKFSGPERYQYNIKFIGNDIVMAGAYNKTNGYIDTILLPSCTSQNAYITRMDSVGHVKWISTFGGSGDDEIRSLDIDAQNNIFVGGGIQDSVSVFGVPINNSGKSVIISKLNENGNLIWLRDINCLGGATSSAAGPLGTANDVFRDHNDNLFVTGSFSGAATFGQFNLTASNTSDMFLARYDTSGNALGIKNFGEAIGVKLSMANSGKITTAGIFYNSITIGNDFYTSYGFNDIYLAQSDEFVGVSEERLTFNQLLIYANPNAGKCTITVPEEFVNEKYLQLNIFDNSGKIIQQKTLEMNDGKIKLNLEEEAKGMYHVTLGNGEKNYSGKIVFE